jgi:hypothetical protein
LCKNWDLHKKCKKKLHIFFAVSECVQRMTLNDEWARREFVILKTCVNEDNMIDAEVMEERLNQLRLYEKKLKFEQISLAEIEIYRFFNGFQV